MKRIKPANVMSQQVGTRMMPKNPNMTQNPLGVRQNLKMFFNEQPNSSRVSSLGASTKRFRKANNLNQSVQEQSSRVLAIKKKVLDSKSGMKPLR